MPPACTKCLTEKEMNDESARNASRLRMNACMCSHALHGQFAHTSLAREKKVGYFLNRPRILSVFFPNKHKINFCFTFTGTISDFPFLLLNHVFAMHSSLSSQNSSNLSSTFLFPILLPPCTPSKPSAHFPPCPLKSTQKK